MVIAATFAAAVMVGAAGCHSSSTAKGAGVDAGTGAGASGSPSSPSSTATTTPTAAASSAAPAPAAKATATSSTGSRSGGGTTTAQKAPGSPTGFTRAGTYTYDLSGTAKQPFGGSQNVSGTDSEAVDAPQGSRQHTRTSGQNGSQDLTLAVAKDGLHVVDIAIASPGFNEDFHPVGNAVYFPADFKVGEKWSWQAKSTDGKYTLGVTTAISGSTSMSVGGKSLKVLVVDSTLHITGSAFDVTAQQRDWVSTAYALVLKEHTVTHGTAFGAGLSSDVTRKLRSTTPS
jgi:hypothetical protein